MSRFPALPSQAADGRKIAIHAWTGEAWRDHSYDELRQTVAAVTGAILALGLPARSRLALCAANSFEYLCTYFAIQAAGHCAVVVNHKAGADTVAYTLEDSMCVLAFCDKDRAALLPRAARPVCFGDATWERMTAAAPGAPQPAAADQTGVIMYTSGSTGQPKGVPLSHSGLLWALETRLRMAPAAADHRFLVAAPLYHMNGQGNATFALHAGATLILLPSFSPETFAAGIGTQRATWVTSVPSMLALLLQAEDVMAATDTSAVRAIRLGSSSFTERLLQEVRRAFPNATVTNSFGVTETGPLSFGPGPGGEAVPDMALGWPLPGVQARVVDAEGRDAPEGVLWLKTPATMTGYLNQPGKSAEVLTPDGWFRSSDVFSVDVSGCFRFVGRADDMFKCGGETVYPTAVEKLLEQHPAVAQACVVPLEDRVKGFKPVAFVVPKPGAVVTEDDLRRHTLATGPAHAHVRRVALMDQLPSLGNYKIDRRALAREAALRWGTAAQPA